MFDVWHIHLFFKNQWNEIWKKWRRRNGLCTLRMKFETWIIYCIEILVAATTIHQTHCSTHKILSNEVIKMHSKFEHVLVGSIAAIRMLDGMIHSKKSAHNKQFNRKRFIAFDPFLLLFLLLLPFLRMYSSYVSSATTWYYYCHIRTLTVCAFLFEAVQ